MFKKTLLVTIIAVAAAGSAFADGFYVGAGIGGSNLNEKLTAADVDNIYNDGASDMGKLGFLGSIFGGYTFNFSNQMNLGLEVFGNATNAKASDSDYQGTMSMKQRYQYGIRALPGYQITQDSDLHAIVGFIRGNFRLTDSGLVQSGVDSTFNANGYELGFGAGTNVAKNINVRADVIYNGYQTKTVNTTAGDSYKNQLHSWDGLLSVAYKFG
jgi:opacity protein-like surface antigen